MTTLHVDSDTVLHELDDDGVVLLTLNRPERSNAWSVEMGAALHELLLQASDDADVRAIVLTGAGRAFCPGFDSADLSSSADGELPSDEGRMQPLVPAMVPKPIVCAINGACAGIGLITALMCDVRFANAEAKLATAFSKLGLPAEEGVSWLLPRMIGHAAALDLLLSSRPVTGAEAATLGMVHRSLPAAEVLPTALAYARNLAQTCSPGAMAVIKRQVYRDWDEPLAVSRRDGRQLMQELTDHSDFAEGVRSFIERHAPDFEGFAEALDRDTLRLEP